MGDRSTADHRMPLRGPTEIYFDYKSQPAISQSVFLRRKPSVTALIITHPFCLLAAVPLPALAQAPAPPQPAPPRPAPPPASTSLHLPSKHHRAPVNVQLRTTHIQMAKAAAPKKSPVKAASPKPSPKKVTKTKSPKKVAKKSPKKGAKGGAAKKVTF